MDAATRQGMQRSFGKQRPARFVPGYPWHRERNAARVDMGRCPIPLSSAIEIAHLWQGAAARVSSQDHRDGCLLSLDDQDDSPGPQAFGTCLSSILPQSLHPARLKSKKAKPLPTLRCVFDALRFQPDHPMTHLSELGQCARWTILAQSNVHESSRAYPLCCGINKSPLLLDHQDQTAQGIHPLISHPCMVRWNSCCRSDKSLHKQFPQAGKKAVRSRQ